MCSFQLHGSDRLAPVLQAPGTGRPVRARSPLSTPSVRFRDHPDRMNPPDAVFGSDREPR